MECPELDTRGNIFANGYLLSELGINNDLDVSFAYRNSYCLEMTLPPRDNPKGLADEPVDGVGSLVAGVIVSLSISIDREKVLGKVAYGIIYEGTWRRRKVAVKRIPIEKVQNNKGGEETLQYLYHPHVVKLYHVDSN
ncbi:hypothetical protein DAPPUDRAFT_260556 [Daphnia pulex]|uniref:Protein kinase domain-containing protein n=1 Tax=Daphnia pulex TaxID=6669 RepID=E9HJF6_DAPPU|nr:hypothetical protein DAPPUDRAFT_260556 [Daphnia pulex]|eukprot:EFX68076.1 hypothetical protein DAPPUDRAFT_260556 [Daphnia pulex]